MLCRYQVHHQLSDVMLSVHDLQTDTQQLQADSQQCCSNVTAYRQQLHADSQQSQTQLAGITQQLSALSQVITLSFSFYLLFFFPEAEYKSRRIV
jgi:uncharacterized phage infection (PIP) family protein YhgE